MLAAVLLKFGVYSASAAGPQGVNRALISSQSLRSCGRAETID